MRNARWFGWLLLGWLLWGAGSCGHPGLVWADSPSPYQKGPAIKIYASKDNLADMVVLDVDGHYLHRVREVYLFVNNVQRTTRARLTSYDGLIRPTTLEPPVDCEEIESYETVDLEKLRSLIAAAPAATAQQAR